MRVGIGTKLAGGFGLVLLLLAVNLWTGLHGLQQVVDTYENEVLRIAETARLTAAASSHVYSEGMATSTFMVLRNQAYRQQFDTTVRQMQETIAALQRLVSSQEARTLVQEVARRHQQYVELTSRVFEGMSQEELALRSTTLATTRNQLMQALDSLADYQARRLQETRLAAEQAEAQARSIMVVSTALALIVGLSASFLIHRNITGTVRQVAEAAKRLATGDLSLEQLAVNSNDDIGEMANAFNTMTANLRDIMAQIQKAGRELTENSRQLAAAADQSASASAQITSSMEQVAEGAHRQAESANETASAVEELRAAIQQIAAGAQHQASQAGEIRHLVEQMAKSLDQMARSAREVAQQAANDLDSARSGGQAVKETIEGMTRISQAVSDAAQRVQQLGRQSQKIGEIVQLISEIAEQTNLLALNAAIEAARAGEHGRGFAVVAEEVRKLAERSAESTREIASLVESIQAGVAEAVSAVQAGTQEAEMGSQLAVRAGEALEQIVEGIQRSTQRVQGIAAAAEQVARDSGEVARRVAEVARISEDNQQSTAAMSTSSQQVAESIQQVSAIAEETAAAAEEVASSTEEVNTSIDSMRQAVKQQTALAQRLDQLIQRFKL